MNNALCEHDLFVCNIANIYLNKNAFSHSLFTVSIDFLPFWMSWWPKFFILTWEMKKGENRIWQRGEFCGSFSFSLSINSLLYIFFGVSCSPLTEILMLKIIHFAAAACLRKFHNEASFHTLFYGYVFAKWIIKVSMNTDQEVETFELWGTLQLKEIVFMSFFKVSNSKICSMKCF